MMKFEDFLSEKWRGHEKQMDISITFKSEKDKKEWMRRNYIRVDDRDIIKETATSLVLPWYWEDKVSENESQVLSVRKRGY